MRQLFCSLFIVVSVFSTVTPGVAQSIYEPFFVEALAGNPPGSADGTGAAARFYSPVDTAVDASGTVYVADHLNHTIRKITPGGEVTTVAGLAGHSGSVDGTGSAARFRYPQRVAVDNAGNLYVTVNCTVRKITPEGVVSTFAGVAGERGSTDGTGSAARFGYPNGVAVDSAGMVYVADSGNNTIRKITADGVVSTLAGLAGSSGTANGTGSNARFNFPGGLASDSAGFVYVADTWSHTIRKITPAGAVTTLAGSVFWGGFANGVGSQARFNYPSDITVDSAGYCYVADQLNSMIRKISPSAAVTTLASTGSPIGVSVDTGGFLYAAEPWNDVIRKIGPTGSLTVLAGAPRYGSADGSASAARFSFPRGFVIDQSGNLFLADTGNHVIRKMDANGVVTTVAGLAGSYGSADGTGSTARFSSPRAVTVDGTGNLYVSDSGNYTVRKISPLGVVTTLAGLAGVYGSADGMGSAARFGNTEGIAVDTSRNVYLVDSSHSTLRKITPAGLVTTLAGSAGSIGFSDGWGANAQFDYPSGLSIDANSTLYVADRSRIRKVTLAGVVSTLAGNIEDGTADGTGSVARFNRPRSLTVDNIGNVYVTDSSNGTIRKITPAGTVTTLAGLPREVGYANGLGSAALFEYPEAITVDSAGSLFIADRHAIRRATAVAAFQVTGVVSRKTHGAAGHFDIDLPLKGEPGVECRASGDSHTLVFSFSNDVVAGEAVITTGFGSVAAAPTFAAKTMTVTLAGATDMQKITVRVSGLADTFGQSIPETEVAMNLLVGDVNGNKTVNASDIGETKGQSGAPASAANFRTDVNASGTVNASDIVLVKSNGGQSFP